jgi:multiple sugar transport system substrate-binding protein
MPDNGAIGFSLFRDPRFVFTLLPNSTAASCRNGVKPIPAIHILALFILLFTARPSISTEGKIDLHVWGANMGEPKLGWYALIDAFEAKYPNVNVAIGPTDRASDLQKLLSGVVGDSPPDVFRREAQMFGDIAARDILLPLDEYVKKDREDPEGLHEADYPPGIWDAGKYEGVLYGVSESVNPFLLAYNKDHFREVGLDPENPPETWDEWLDAIRLLTLLDENGRVIRAGFSAHRFDILQFYILQQGAWVTSEDGRTCIKECPEAIRAAELTAALSNAIGGREASDQFWATIVGEQAGLSPLAMGKCSMSIEDDWIIFRTMRFFPDFNLGITPVPHPVGQDPITVSTTHTLCFIPRNARHPNEAWDFIRFLCSTEGQLAYAAAMDREAKKTGYSGSPWETRFSWSSPFPWEWRPAWGSPSC